MSKETETFQIPENEYRALEAIAKKTGFESVDDLVNDIVSEFIRKMLIEKEEVTIKVPKKLLALVKDLRSKDWKEYLSDSLTDSVAADIVAEVFGEFDQVVEKYGLAEEFQFYEGH